MICCLWMVNKVSRNTSSLSSESHRDFVKKDCAGRENLSIHIVLITLPDLNVILTWFYPNYRNKVCVVKALQSALMV